MPPYPHTCFSVGVPGVVGGRRSESRSVPHTNYKLQSFQRLLCQCSFHARHWANQTLCMPDSLNPQMALGLEVGAVMHPHFNFSEQEMEADGAVNSHATDPGCLCGASWGSAAGTLPGLPIRWHLTYFASQTQPKQLLPPQTCFYLSFPIPAMKSPSTLPDAQANNLL